MASADWREVLQFWFVESTPQMWFKKDLAFDERVRSRFEHVHEQASRCELAPWRDTIEGRLAEIIVLDQFSRNMYRGLPKAFAQDALALALAQEALRYPQHKTLSAAQRSFLYMPFMHSESRLIHEQALKLFAEEGLEDNLKFEVLHKEQIDQFGRYPHRNEILGRVSTPEEIAFLRTSPGGF